MISKGALSYVGRLLTTNRPIRAPCSLCTLLIELADGCIQTGRFADAEPLLRHLLEIREQSLGAEHPIIAGLLHRLAVVYINTGRPAKAEPLPARAIAIVEQAGGLEHPWIAESLHALGKLYRNTGRPAEAEALFKRALNIDKACALLDAAGFGVVPQDTTVELRREGCWAVTSPGGRMALFPITAKARQRLATERRLLRLLAKRCSFRVPRILHEAEAGWDVRSVFPGTFDARGLYERIRADRELARRLGRAVGGVLAEQHTRVRREDVAGWLPEALNWPPPGWWMCAHLSAVVDDSGLLAAIEQVLRRYEDQEAAADDRVLLHANLGLHNLTFEPTNIAVDRATDDLVGVSGYAEAVLADRHHDFRYLVFDYPDDEAVLDGALEVYEPVTGVRIDRERVRLCNAACAIGFLALRQDVPPEADSCGRTLAEDLRWLRHALSAIGLDPT